VEAAFSKRKRRDTVVLHPELVRQLQEWLSTKKLNRSQPLFPISKRMPGYSERKTNKMIRLDLEAARKNWIESTEDAKERTWREESDFLRYRNHAGLYADFHSCRHLFITSLARAGVQPKVAQALARHSDIRLTLGVYTHADLGEQVAAIEALGKPPGQRR
jgi:integrase